MPAVMIAQAREMMARSTTAKFTVAPTRPNSTGMVTKRQNQRSWRSTMRATCGPLSSARAAERMLGGAFTTDVRVNSGTRYDNWHTVHGKDLLLAYVGS